MSAETPAEAGRSGSVVFRSTVLLLALGFLALLGIVVLTFMLAERSRLYVDAVTEARIMRTSATELRNALLTAESSQRGFLVGGNEVYLAPYDTAQRQARRQLDVLRRLLAADDGRTKPMERLATLVTDKIAEMDETIALKRQRREDELDAIFRTNRGKALMDEANIFLTGIVLTADDRLTQGVAEQRVNADQLRVVTIVGGIGIVAVVGFAIALIIRYARDLSAASRELSTLNLGLEERVRERTSDLAEANEEIQRFAYIVTHDLRAPLVNIMGFTSELESGVRSLQTLIERSGIGSDQADALVREATVAAQEDLPEAIGFIRSSTRKMDNLINAILKLSREGRRTLRPERLDVRTVIDGAIGSVQHQLLEAGGAVTVDVDVPHVESDRLALEQVFGNLLDNAVKYRDRERALAVAVRGARIGSNRVAIEIEDNGRGIAEQDLKRVFDLFRRAGAQDQPGEGIGLAHVRAVLRRLGGDIDLVSVLDRGTTFRIVLPIRHSFSESVPT